MNSHNFMVKGLMKNQNFQPFFKQTLAVRNSIFSQLLYEIILFIEVLAYSYL